MNDSLLLQILPEGIPRQPSLVDLLRRCVCSEKYPANFPWFNYFLCPNPWVKDLWSFKTILLILFYSMQWSRIVKFVKYENNEKYWPWHKHMVTWMCVSGPPSVRLSSGGWYCFNKENCDTRYETMRRLMSSSKWPQTKTGQHHARERRPLSPAHTVSNR